MIDFRSGREPKSSNYDFINIRIAVAPSGEVLAVASERIRSVEEFAPVIQRSASRLKEKVAAHYGR